MLKKVLVLGSSGTLGQTLVSEFKNGNYEVIAWDKEDVDATSPELDSKILALKPDIIVNATAYNAVDKAEADEEERKIAFTINRDIPTRLAQVAKQIDAVLVHYSTNYVFNGQNKKGYTEFDKPSPINKYGDSKLAGETGVQKTDGKHYIIRLSRLFGVRGVSPASKRTFVEIMMGELEKESLEVGNTEVSGLTYAPDLAKLTREIVEREEPWGIYHGTNEGECTWYEWAKEIFKILKKGPEVIPAPHSLTPKITKHPVYATLLNTKLPKQRSWQDALKEFLLKK